MERVIEIKKKDVRGPFGEFERKECNVTVLENGLKKEIPCYMDTDDILGFIEKYQRHLSFSKEKLLKRNKEDRIKRRIKYNLFAMPAYLVFLITFPIALNLPEVAGIPLGILSVATGSIAALAANFKALYFDPSEQVRLEDLEQKIKESTELENEAVDEIAKKDTNDFFRADIQHKALRRRQEQENDIKRFLKKINERRERGRLVQIENMNIIANQDELGVPEYMKRSR